MSTITSPPNGLTQATPTPVVRVASRAQDSTPGQSNLMDSDKFAQLQRVASAMASGSLTPKHLLGSGKNADQQTVANCIRVANQAFRWGLDPFSVMDETYVVHGKLGYQGKLVAAVVNTRAGLIGRLVPKWSGNTDGRSPDTRMITISGMFDGEDEPREITLTVGQARTDNEMWKKDPDQKLWYSGAIKWARCHCPEVILGIVTDDDLERLRMVGELADGSNPQAKVQRSALNETLAQSQTAEKSEENNAAGIENAGEESQVEMFPEDGKKK